MLLQLFCSKNIFKSLKFYQSHLQSTLRNNLYKLFRLVKNVLSYTSDFFNFYEYFHILYEALEYFCRKKSLLFPSLFIFLVYAIS